MSKHGLFCRPVSVCLSVCLSVTLVHCIQTAKDIVKLLYRPGRAIILVFWTASPVPNSKGDPFSGDAKYKGVGKLRFSTEIAVYFRNGKRYAHGYYGTLIGSHMRSIE